MKTFVLSKVGTFDYFEDDAIKKLLHVFWVVWESVSVYEVGGVLFDCDKKTFEKLLPVLNWYFGKYYFLQSLFDWLSKDLIEWIDLYDFKLDEKDVSTINLHVQNIRKELESDKLITFSDKEKYVSQIKDWLFYIITGLITTYFMLLELAKTKSELKNIVNSDTLQEYKSQATLMDTVTWTKITNIKEKMEYLAAQIDALTDIISRYFKISFKI